MEVKVKFKCSGTITRRYIHEMDAEVKTSDGTTGDIAQELESASKFLKDLRELLTT